MGVRHPSHITMPKGSGLTKALALSPELATLLGTKKGENLSRPEVVKRIWAYLKTISSRTQITSNISLPTLKWNQSSARTKFVLLEWLNSSRLTCPTPRLDLDTSLDISLNTSLTGEISSSIK